MAVYRFNDQPKLWLVWQRNTVSQSADRYGKLYQLGYRIRGLREAHLTMRLSQIKE